MNEIMSADIYKIHDFLNKIKNKHIPAEEANSLLLGMFGYMGEVFSKEIQYITMLSAEWMNEIFPIRAKLEKNLLTHAMMANITNISAVPATMEAFMLIKEKSLLLNMVNDVFIIDKYTKVEVGKFDFHLEYDVKIFRQTLVNDEVMYRAQYDLIDRKNRLSELKNPYLLPIVKFKIGTEDFLFVRVRLRQMSINEVEKKIISNNEIENRTIEFSYENQIADFNVFIDRHREKDTIELTPLYDISPIVDPTGMFCHYKYINTDTIKIVFNKDSYIPKLNDYVRIEIVTTKGVKGNFNYKKDIIVQPFSKVRTYNNILYMVRPISDSHDGEDKKSIKELQTIIPRELLARKSITCTQDLDNYFNSINNKNNRLVFLKKIDNQFERIYYSYLLLKDEKQNIIPTNTVDFLLSDSDYDYSTEERGIIRPGTVFEYNKELKRCQRIDGTSLSNEAVKSKEYSGFLYTSPFTTIINKNPLVASTYLTIFNRVYDLDFSYINEMSQIQFIASRLKWRRDLFTNKNKYIADIEFTQNIDEDLKLVSYDADGVIKNSKIRVFGVLYNKLGLPVRYTEATPLYFDKKSKSYKFRFQIETNDEISRDSRINIISMKEIGSTITMESFFEGNGCKFRVYMFTDTGLVNDNDDIKKMIPDSDKLTLCNIYDIPSGVDFFINFTDIMNIIPTVNKDWTYNIDKVPVVKYSYLTDSEQVNKLVDYIMEKKIYIDTAITVLENNFGIDFKFFNTYGPSKIHYMNNDAKPLDRVDLTLKLNIKFITKSNEGMYVEEIKKEIKKYTEDINDIDGMFMSRIINHLKEKFNNISYIEFIGYNEYDSDYQSIIEIKKDKTTYVPEFLNIGSRETTYVPDIQINVI